MAMTSMRAMSAPRIEASRVFDLALLSDKGTSRPDNEDSCGQMDEEPGRVVFVVADGVGGYNGGEEASRMAVDITIAAFRANPVEWGVAKRLYRAVQQANIEIYERATVVPELRTMRTTITAVAVEGQMLYAAHVGDCRLYLFREGALTQLTKDHTLAAARARIGLISADRLADHPDRSTLTRCLGQDLVIAVDQISRPLQGGDALLLCSDGLYNTLEEAELAKFLAVEDAASVCQSLVLEANARFTHDNLTAAVFRLLGDAPLPEERLGIRGRISRLIGR